MRTRRSTLLALTVSALAVVDLARPQEVGASDSGICWVCNWGVTCADTPWDLACRTGCGPIFYATGCTDDALWLCPGFALLQCQS